MMSFLGSELPMVSYLRIKAQVFPMAYKSLCDMAPLTSLPSQCSCLSNHTSVLAVPKTRQAPF